MRRSAFKWIVAILLVDGILIEVDHAYKQAMHIETVVFPTSDTISLPGTFHHSPGAQIPLVHAFDEMSTMSRDVVFIHPPVVSAHARADSDDRWPGSE